MSRRVWGCLLLLTWGRPRGTVAAFFPSPPPPAAANLNYFAIGSNMVPSTMTSLRNLSPVSATAAILPGYRLAFDVAGGGGGAWSEPSAASARRCHPGPDGDDDGDAAVMHGVLYELSDADFAALGRSEGVPFGYTWERCRVVPYVGDGASAGAHALAAAHMGPSAGSSGGGGGGTAAVDAFVLTASAFARKTSPRDFVPPSRGYLQILRDGAHSWRLDRAYQDELSRIPVDAVVPGVSGLLLRFAEAINPKAPLIDPLR